MTDEQQTQPTEDLTTNCPVHGEQRVDDRSGQCEPCQYSRGIEYPDPQKGEGK